jgi:hypothetical protein
MGYIFVFPPHTCKPIAMHMQQSDEIYMLTTNQFKPHDNLYAINEENMLDWEGNMVERKHRTKILLSGIEENEAMAASVQVSCIESMAIDRALETNDEEEEMVKP